MTRSFLERLNRSVHNEADSRPQLDLDALVWCKVKICPRNPAFPVSLVRCVLGNYDTGAVFVYKFQEIQDEWEAKKLTFTPPKLLTKGCRFGSAVENLGDIHNDGFEDFAVSAPYLENQNGEVTGAVFVYRGNSKLDKLNGKFFIFTFNDKE